MSSNPGMTSMSLHLILCETCELQFPQAFTIFHSCRVIRQMDLRLIYLIEKEHDESFTLKLRRSKSLDPDNSLKTTEAQLRVWKPIFKSFKHKYLTADKFRAEIIGKGLQMFKDLRQVRRKIGLLRTIVKCKLCKSYAEKFCVLS